MCCLKRSDRPPDEKPSYHFHECLDTQKFQLRGRDYSDTCTTDFGRIFTPVELALDCVRARVIRDVNRFKRIRPILLEHRVNVEADLRKASKGLWPAPYLVMEKLLGFPKGKGPTEYE